MEKLRRAGDIRSITHGEARRRWRSAVLVAICCIGAAALGCGSRSADRTAAAAAPGGAGATARTAGTGGKSVVTGSTLATTVHSGFKTNAIACATCHPCGAAGNHALSWMDQGDPNFHAYSANAGLASCQTCHGAKLDGVGGTTTLGCGQCHGATWMTSCTMCHGGTDNATGAPARATWGNAADAVRIGAHTAHVGATHALSPAFDCGVCHVKPADAFAAGHIDGATATVAFAGVA
ncbi:MAG TPA: hypothetical protein VFQ39_19695, partial [Longimicrobium sp.]|nr:hypothetical protein [Longimicrobium sp.]